MCGLEFIFSETRQFIVNDLNICRKDQNSVNIYAVTIGKENGGTRDQNPRWMERRAANHT